MTNNKVVDLKEYKNQKELDRLGELQYQSWTPNEQKGYRNFMRLLKAMDAQYAQKAPEAE